MRILGFLLLTTLLSSCERAKGSPSYTENIGCGTTKVLDQLQRGTEVAFVFNNDPADARVIPGWRAAVGPAVHDRAGRSCEDAPIDSLLVVSWNVHIGHADIRRFVSDLRGGRLIPGVPVRHFVLLLQEAFREGDVVPKTAMSSACPRRMGGSGPDIEDLSDSLALAMFYVPSMRNGCDPGARLQDRGNAILSTLPLTSLKAVELPLVRQRRVVVMADVNGHTSAGANWTLSLASVHFENRAAGTPRDWVRGRARQARVLVSALPDSKLAAVGGDFNTLDGAGEPAVQIVGERFANSPDHPRGISYVSHVMMRSHLDYLFFQSSGPRPAPYWRARARYGSDHYPMMGFIRVR